MVKDLLLTLYQKKISDMNRAFDSTKLDYVANSLKESAHRMSYVGDVSDLGNEIGLVVG